MAIFSKLIKDTDGEPSERAKQLASSFLTLTGLVFIALSALVFFFSQPIMATLLPDASTELITTSAKQLKIMSPIIFFGGLIGIFYGILNIYHSFFWPSLSPTAMSVMILGALLIFPNDGTGMVLAWATLGGAIVQVAMQLPDYLKRRFSIAPNFNFKMPEMKQIGEMLFPATIGTTTGQLNVYVDMFFTSRLVEGGWSAVTMSNRLIQFPIGVLQTALLVPIFPRFSRYVTEGNMDELRRYFKLGVISLWFISMPILIIILMFIEPFVRLVFEHGSFTSSDTKLVSYALSFQAFQIIPYFARDSITRVFYAFQDTKTPLLVGLVSIFFKVLFDWMLVDDYGVAGITLSTAVVTLINMVFLGMLSKRHIEDLGFRSMVVPFFKLATCGLIMATIMRLETNALMAVNLTFLPDLFLPSEQWQELTRVMIAITGGLFIYVITAFAFKVEEAQYFFGRVKSLIIKK